MAGCTKPNSRILEVGCATGVSTEVAAKSLITDGSILVACDFSHAMCKMLSDRFSKSEFLTYDSGNKFIFDSSTDHVQSNTSLIELDKLPLDKKLVFGCQASGTRLPFGDETFDSYVANMVL